MDERLHRPPAVRYVAIGGCGEGGEEGFLFGVGPTAAPASDRWEGEETACCADGTAHPQRAMGGKQPQGEARRLLRHQRADQPQPIGRLESQRRPPSAIRLFYCAGGVSADGADEDPEYGATEGEKDLRLVWKRGMREPQPALDGCRCEE